DHDERHLEPGGSRERVGGVSGKNDGLPRFHRVGHPCDPHLALTVEDGHHRVVGCGMLREPLVLVERKDGDAPSLVVDDHPARNGSVLVLNEVLHLEDASKQILFTSTCHGDRFLSLVSWVVLPAVPECPLDRTFIDASPAEVTFALCIITPRLVCRANF